MARKFTNKQVPIIRNFIVCMKHLPIWRFPCFHYSLSGPSECRTCRQYMIDGIYKKLDQIQKMKNKS